jgi:hypothetical protein
LRGRKLGGEVVGVYGETVTTCACAPTATRAIAAAAKKALSNKPPPESFDDLIIILHPMAKKPGGSSYFWLRRAAVNSKRPASFKISVTRLLLSLGLLSV